MVINTQQPILPILLPFTIIYVSKVVHIHCICVVETLGNGVKLAATAN